MQRMMGTLVVVSVLILLSTTEACHPMVEVHNELDVS